MDIKITQGSTTVWLNGSGVSGAIKAGRFAGGACDELELALEGNPASIAAGLSRVERLLVDAERTFGMPNETPVYLSVTLADGVSWQSPLKGGWAELGSSPAGRKINQQGVKLHLERESFWEKTSYTYVTLTNQHGAATKISVYNHDDAAHDNHADIAADAVAGDLPAPALVKIGKYDQPDRANSEIFLGQLVFGTGSAFTEQLEGEAGAEGAGVTSTHTADANCSGGNYDALSWSGTSKVILKQYGISAAVAAAAGGRVFRPVARVRDLVTAGELIWAYWQAGWWDTNTTYEMLQDCEGMLLSTARKLQVFPPLYLPPWPKARDGSEAAGLQLQVQAAAAGAHTVNLDFVQLMPMDGWLHLIPVLTQMVDLELTYDCASGTMWRNQFTVLSHYGEGPGIWLYPGQASRLYFVSQVAGTMTISLDFDLEIGYKARKRAL